MRTLFQKILFAVCMLACAMLVAFNTEAMQAARAGFDLWVESLMPALLPFFICTSLLKNTGLLTSATPFGLVLLSFVSGAPSGARLCGEAYGHEEAPTKLFSALNVISPMFIYGSFATSMLGISRIATPVILSQLIAVALSLPFAFRSDSQKRNTGAPAALQARPFSEALFDAIRSSMFAVLNICATVILFMVFLRLLLASGALDVLAYPLEWLLGILGVTKELAKPILSGIIEVSNGCKALSALDLPIRTTAAVSAFFFSFGGLCVMAQSAGFVRIEAKKYLPFKFLQGLTAGTLAYFITPLFITDVATVFEPFHEKTFSDNALSSSMIFAASLLGVATVALLSAAAQRKRKKNRQ